MPPAAKTVCVMDASTRVGSALVAALLHRGYTVHASLQNHGINIKSKRCFLFLFWFWIWISFWFPFSLKFVASCQMICSVWREIPTNWRFSVRICWIITALWSLLKDAPLCSIHFNLLLIIPPTMYLSLSLLSLSKKEFCFSFFLSI